MGRGINNTYTYTNETYSGCDIVASIDMNLEKIDEQGKAYIEPYTKVIGQLQTISYSINMDKKPVRSIGNINVKDYTTGPRTIAGSLVFSVFNKHFAEDILVDINDSYKKGKAFLVDELPPFNITLSFANEYGYRSRSTIYGVRLLNEGQVMSINDIYTENTYQFFATDLEYLSDEMEYAWNGDIKKYQLIDKNIETNKYEAIKEKVKEIIKWDNAAKKEYYEIINGPINLMVVTRNASRKNNKGSAYFSVDPAQDSGYIYLTDSMKQVKKYKIGEKDNNRTYRALSIMIDPGKYEAYFENEVTKKLSNTVIFKIEDHRNEDPLLMYAPSIDYISNDYISIISNEPSHNVLEIYDMQNNIIGITQIVNRKASYYNLSEDTSYIIKTKNNIDNIYSKELIVTTLDRYDRLYDEVENMCITNMNHLAQSDINIYRSLITEAKDLAIKNKNQDISSIFMLLKDKYKKLYNDAKDETLKYGYDLNIKATNEILLVVIKINGDYSGSLNEKVIVPIPTMTLNKKYENIVSFDQSIDAAEFYHRLNNVSQLVTNTKSYNFKNIDGIDNSFRFIGRQGSNHYVEAVSEGRRSQKLEFYVLSEKEKEYFIERDLAIEKLTDKDIVQIEDEIKEPDIYSTEYKIKFMLKAKNIEKSLFMPPDVYEIDKNILIQTGIESLTSTTETKVYYLAIANYQDILNNKMLYKVKFTNKDEFIAIFKTFHGIIENENYIVWIEDENNTQISNPSSLTYVKDFDNYEDGFRNYENDIYIEPIINMLKSQLNKEQLDSISSNILNNQYITNINVIPYLLYLINNLTIESNKFKNLFAAVSKYIGTLINSSDLITDVNYNKNINKLTFNSLYKGTIITYNIDSDFNIINQELNESNSILIDSSKIIVCINEDLTKKSQVIYINNKNNSMEVLS